jgi:hypothetical protein
MGVLVKATVGEAVGPGRAVGGIFVTAVGVTSLPQAETINISTTDQINIRYAKYLGVNDLPDIQVTPTNIYED